MRDMGETLFQITVGDIYEVWDCDPDHDEAKLTEEVVEKVCHKIEAMDFGDTLNDTITEFINDAILEVAKSKD